MPAPLSPRKLRERLAYDFEVLDGLSRELIAAIDGYASPAAFRAGRPVSDDEGFAGDAVLFAVELRFPFLVGPGRTHASVRLLYDLLAGGSYPFSDPGVAVVSRPLPWNPHVNPLTGLFCIGRGWQNAGGRMLAAELVIHTMRLLNLDEPRTWADGGWNPEADAYYHHVLKRRPHLPELQYPRLPLELTHGIDVDANVFRPLEPGAEPLDPDDFVEPFRAVGRQ